VTENKEVPEYIVLDVHFCSWNILLYVLCMTGWHREQWDFQNNGLFLDGTVIMFMPTSEGLMP
jgi:hypothetical protein